MKALLVDTIVEARPTEGHRCPPAAESPCVTGDLGVLHGRRRHARDPAAPALLRARVPALAERRAEQLALGRLAVVLPGHAA